VFVLALEAEVLVGDARSLKDKRQVVTSVLDASRHRFGVSAAEIAHQELWQRAGLGFATVASSAAHATAIIDSVDRFLWSRPELSVLTTDRRWLE
jgi:uncharacterized protein YlxP (DUF503 family)